MRLRLYRFKNPNLTGLDRNFAAMVMEFSDELKVASAVFTPVSCPITEYLKGYLYACPHLRMPDDQLLSR